MMSVFLMLMLGGYLVLVFFGLVGWVVYKNLNVLMMVLVLLVVVDMLWYVDFNFVGKILVGMMNVVVFGLKLEKKNVSEYMIMNSIRFCGCV